MPSTKLGRLPTEVSRDLPVDQPLRRGTDDHRHGVSRRTERSLAAWQPRSVISHQTTALRDLRVPTRPRSSVPAGRLPKSDSSLPKPDMSTPEGPAVVRLGPSDLHFRWGERGDLNPRHPGPQPGALPTELRPPSSPGHTAGPQQDARCPEGHRAAEDEYSGLRRPALHAPAAPAEPAEEYRAAIARAVAESGPGCGTNSASR
jgi:hypothetical protein